MSLVNDVVDVVVDDDDDADIPQRLRDEAGPYEFVAGGALPAGSLVAKHTPRFFAWHDEVGASDAVYDAVCAALSTEVGGGSVQAYCERVVDVADLHTQRGVCVVSPRLRAHFATSCRPNCEIAAVYTRSATAHRPYVSVSVYVVRDVTRGDALTLRAPGGASLYAAYEDRQDAHQRVYGCACTCERCTSATTRAADFRRMETLRCTECAADDGGVLVPAPPLWWRCTRCDACVPSAYVDTVLDDKTLIYDSAAALIRVPSATAAAAVGMVQLEALLFPPRPSPRVLVAAHTLHFTAALAYATVVTRDSVRTTPAHLERAISALLAALAMATGGDGGGDDTLSPWSLEVAAYYVRLARLLVLLTGGECSASVRTHRLELYARVCSVVAALASLIGGALEVGDRTALPPHFGTGDALAPLVRAAAFAVDVFKD